MQTNWRKLNKEINTLTEAQVLEMLTAERAGRKRVSILERLHQRYTVLRATRERIEILKEATAP